MAKVIFVVLFIFADGSDGLNIHETRLNVVSMEACETGVQIALSGPSVVNELLVIDAWCEYQH